jgi:hypothetical protein
MNRRQIQPAAFPAQNPQHKEPHPYRYGQEWKANIPEIEGHGAQVQDLLVTEFSSPPREPPRENLGAVSGVMGSTSASG